MTTDPTRPELADRHLVLIGLMGTGKSTIGPLLAGELGRPFIDLDDELATRTGRSVRELLSADPADFRAREAEVLADLLGRGGPMVLATGGGAVLDPRSRQLLAGPPVVVWLQAPTTVLVARVAGSGVADRPLLDGGPEAVLERLATERSPLYAEVADLSVDSSSDGPTGVAASILAALGGMGGRADAVEAEDGCDDPSLIDRVTS